MIQTLPARIQGAIKHGLLLLICSTLFACVTVEDSAFKKSENVDATEARVKVAIAYLQRKETSEAIRHLNTALEDAPNSPRVHEVLAIAFQQNGDLDLTETHYEKVLKIDSDYTRGRNNYASFLYDQKRYQEALVQFEQVVKDVYYGNRAVAFVNLGRCALKLDNIEIAERSFTRAVELDRNQSAGLMELSDIFYEQGEFESAQNLLDKYRQLVEKKSPRSLLLGVRLAHERGDQDAIASYSMVLKNMYPDSGEYRELQRLQAAYD
jgi:type IV pilus assembly protein PilF